MKHPRSRAESRVAGAEGSRRDQKKGCWSGAVRCLSRGRMHQEPVRGCWGRMHMARITGIFEC